MRNQNGPSNRRLAPLRAPVYARAMETASAEQPFFSHRFDLMTDKTDDILQAVRALSADLRVAPKHATAEQVERIANVALENHKALNKKIDDVYGSLDGRIVGVEKRLSTHDIALDSVHAKIMRVSMPPVRSMSPLPRKYDFKPEETSPGGGLRIAREDWEQAQEQIDETASQVAALLAERDAARAAELKAQERQAAVQAYVLKQEQEAAKQAEEAEVQRRKDAKTRRQLLKIIAGLAAAGPTIGAVVHWLHW
jgi:hypothetical protein